MQKFDIKPKIYFGTNSLKILNEIQAKKAFVITDPFMVENESIKLVLDKLKKEIEVDIFSNVRPDPDSKLIANGMEKILISDPDLLIACGGGSTIDAAKSILHFSKKIMSDDKEVIFIAIPTTSGTGSEVTNFSVIKVDNNKIPIIDDQLLPDMAILDSSLTKTVPKSVTADTGMDVLTHAIEAYVSKEATTFTDALSEKVVELVFEYLPKVVRNGNDLDSRNYMHEASCIAGMAFTNASLGICHSLAHAIGGMMGLAHGRANAIILPNIVEYNSRDELARKKYSILAWKLGLTKEIEKNGYIILIKAIRALEKLIGIPNSFLECGLKLEEFNKNKVKMANMALNDNCTITNPVKPSIDDLLRIYENCMIGE